MDEPIWKPFGLHERHSGDGFWEADTFSGAQPVTVGCSGKQEFFCLNLRCLKEFTARDATNADPVLKLKSPRSVKKEGRQRALCKGCQM